MSAEFRLHLLHFCACSHVAFGYNAEVCLFLGAKSHPYLPQTCVLTSDLIPFPTLTLQFFPRYCMCTLCCADRSDDGRTLTYGPHSEAPLAEELAASAPEVAASISRRSGGAPQQAQQAASTRLREQAQHAEQVDTERVSHCCCSPTTTTGC